MTRTPQVGEPVRYSLAGSVSPGLVAGSIAEGIVDVWVLPSDGSAPRLMRNVVDREWWSASVEHDGSARAELAFWERAT